MERTKGIKHKWKKERKITNEMILKITELRKNGKKLKEIKNETGINTCTISLICNKKYRFS